MQFNLLYSLINGKLMQTMYAKQFRVAKIDECKSWRDDNDVYDLVDMRKLNVKNQA